MPTPKTTPAAANKAPLSTAHAYAVRFKRGGKAATVLNGQLIQVFLSSGDALTYACDAIVKGNAWVNDVTTKDLDESTQLGMVFLPDSVIGKELMLRAPVPGDDGAYVANLKSSDLAKVEGPVGEVDALAKLGAKTAIALSWTAVAPADRDAFYLDLAKASYPTVAALDQLGGIQSGLWAEASLLVALLETAEELKNRVAYPAAPAVAKARAALSDAAPKLGLPGVHAAKYKVSDADIVQKSFEGDFLDPNMFIFNGYFEPTDGRAIMRAQGRLKMLARAFGKGAIAAQPKVAAFFNAFLEPLRQRVLVEAKRIYREVFATSDVLGSDGKDFAELPEAVLAAVGDGTGTAGLLGKTNECAGIMAYQASTTETIDRFDDPPAGSTKPAKLTLPSLSVATFDFVHPTSPYQTLLHFFTTGFDYENKQNLVEVRCGKKFTGTLDGKPADGWPWRVQLYATKDPNGVGGNMFLHGIWEEKLVNGGVKSSLSRHGPDNTPLPDYSPSAAGADGWQSLRGFRWNRSRRDLVFPPSVFKETKNFEVMVSSGKKSDPDFDEIFYGLCVVLSNEPVKIDDLYPFGGFYAPPKASLTADTVAKLQQVRDMLDSYDKLSTLMIGGGVGRYRDPKNQADVIAGGVVDSSATASKDDWANLRCTYVEFSGEGDRLVMTMRSYTDPVRIKDNPWFKNNVELSRLRCWGMLGLIARSYMETADAIPFTDGNDHAKVMETRQKRKPWYEKALAVFDSVDLNALFDPRDPGSNKQSYYREMYLNATDIPADFLPEGRFDYDECKKRLANMNLTT